MVRFRFDEPVARRAYREYWLDPGKVLIDPSTYVVAVAGALLLAWTARGELSVGRFVLLSAGPAIWVLGAAAWIGWGWWLRREMAERRGGITDPTVVIELCPTDLEIRTEHELIRPRWTDVTQARVLRTFLLLHFRGGTQFPVPLTALGPALLADFLATARRHGAECNR